MSSKQYGQWLLLSSFSFLLFLSGLVIWVDPYLLFGTQSWPTCHTMEGFERYIKPVLVERKKPKAVLLGSSRVAVGFDPEVVARLTGDSTYNFGINGAQIDEVFAGLVHAVERCGSRRAIIGLDYFAFTRLSPRHAQIVAWRNQGWWRQVSVLLKMTTSLRALKDSSWTIWSSFKGRPLTHDENGRYQGYVPANIPFGDPLPQKEAPSSAAYEVFRELLQYSRSRNIRLHFFRPPTFHAHRRRDHRYNQWVANVEAMAEKEGFRVIGFDQEPSLLERREDYYDPGHFKLHVGERVLQQLFQQH